MRHALGDPHDVPFAQLIGLAAGDLEPRICPGPVSCPYDLAAEHLRRLPSSRKTNPPRRHESRQWANYPPEHMAHCENHPTHRDLVLRKRPGLPHRRRHFVVIGIDNFGFRVRDEHWNDDDRCSSTASRSRTPAASRRARRAHRLRQALRARARGKHSFAVVT